VALGDQGDYFKDIHLDKSSYITRFYNTNNGSGIFDVEEEFNFCQDDLHDTNVVILDTFYNIYVWLGRKSIDLVKKMAMQTAIEYVKQSKVGHVESTAIWCVFGNHEPIQFRAHFKGGWQDTNFLKEKGPISFEMKAGVPVQEILKDYLQQTYTFEELTSKNLPKGVDASKLDIYLSEEEFVQVFKMSRADYNNMLPWKRELTKKNVGLF